jgi:uncharacterized membrane protein YbhN (UPF0104 family)
VVLRQPPLLHATAVDRWRVVTVVAALAVLAPLWALASDTDSLAALASATDGVTAAIGRVPWPVVAAGVVALTLGVAHYLLAAVAIRVSSGRPLPLGEATLSQLASSVFNRVVPGGIGGAATNARYLSRRGLPMGAALAAVGTLGVLGAVADLLGAGLLLLGGASVDLGGGTQELGVLAAAGMRWAPVSHLTGAAVAAIALLAAGGAAYFIGRRRRRNRAAGAGAGPGRGAHAMRQLAELVRRPDRISTLLVASAGTTFVLAFAFAVVVRAVAGAAAPSLAALLVVYLVGAAAASAVHVPAVAGPAEIALTAALVASGVGAGPALVSVLVFRGITYWAPVPVGVLAVRSLRRRGAL